MDKLTNAIFSSARYNQPCHVEIDGCFEVYVRYGRDDELHCDYVDVFYSGNDEFVMRVAFTGELTQTADAIYAALRVISVRD